MTTDHHWISTYFNLNDDMSAIEKYLDYANYKYYKKGDIIIPVGVSLDYLIYLKKGQAGRLVTTAGGAQKYIKIVTDHGIIGEVIFFQHITSDYTFEAITPCECYFFNRTTVETLFLKDDAIIQSLINWFCNRLYSLNAQIQSSMLQNNYDRVCSFLSDYIKTFGYCDSNGHWRYDGKLSHYDIAKYIGINRVSVTRAITKLQENEIIKKDRHSLIILDITYLERY